MVAACRTTGFNISNRFLLRNHAAAPEDGAIFILEQSQPVRLHSGLALSLAEVPNFVLGFCGEPLVYKPRTTASCIRGRLSGLPFSASFRRTSTPEEIKIIERLLSLIRKPQRAERDFENWPTPRHSDSAQGRQAPVVRLDKFGDYRAQKSGACAKQTTFQQT